MAPGVIALAVALAVKANKNPHGGEGGKNCLPQAAHFHSVPHTPTHTPYTRTYGNKQINNFKSV